MGHLERAAPGDRIIQRADDRNAFIDAAEAFKAGQLSTLRGNDQDSLSEGIVLIKNDSGEDIIRFGVLGIESVIYDHADNANEFKNGTALVGKKPDIDDHFGHFVVLLEPVKDGKIGHAVLQGRSRVKIDVIAEGDQYADIKDDNATQLESSDVGAARILYKDTGTGEQWADILIGSVAGTGRFELTEDLSAGSDATAKRLAWVASSYDKVGENFDLYDDLYGNVAGDEGDKGTYFWDHGRRIILTIQCP